MSLTSMLKNDKNIVKLFSAIPDVQSLFKFYQPKEMENNQVVVPRYRNANPSLVGTAYDFWCRAHIQRLNGEEKEVEISRQVLAGITRAIDLGFLNDEEAEILFENVEIIWRIRSRYINGETVDETKLLKGSLILANCEATYRNSKKPTGNYLTIKKADYYDLVNLCQATKTVPRIFQTDKGVLLNPTFGDYSKIVGGADADYVIGNMLVDLKTSQYSNIKKEYIHQLIGYYLLSNYDKTFPCKIIQIGVYFARYNKLAFIDIRDLNQVVNLKALSGYFKEYISGKRDRLEHMQYNELKQILALNKERLTK